MADTSIPQSPLLTLLSVLSTSIQTIEAELKAGNMPTFTFDPKWHPLDSLDAVPAPRLHEARRVAMASANMIKALVQDVGTAMIDMSTQALDQSAYLLTADIGLIDVFKTDEEKSAGLHIEEIVARLPEGKKVHPQKLARCLRLLSTEHWWIEPTPDVFAPLRWALLNAPGSPSWAWADPAAYSSLVAATAMVEQMTDPAQLEDGAVEVAPLVRGLHSMGKTHIKDFWDWFVHEPDRLARFAQSMEGQGYMSLPGIKGDYPWAALPADTTFVDVGAGQGTVSLHVLKTVYDKLPGFKVVLQDRSQHLDTGKLYWARQFPKAVEDGRVEFEPHDFFEANPRKEPNSVYFFRYIMHDWSDEFAIKILKGIRASCHPTSRVLIADCVMLEAIPTEPCDTPLEKILESIDNNAPYKPIRAPYPIPQNGGFASKSAHQCDILMHNLLNALERTADNFRTIIQASGFMLNRIYPTRSITSILELFPILPQEGVSHTTL